MEVVVAAAVLVLVVLGVLAAMDSISGTAGANQARTVAAALAEEDQESLRGLSTEDLDRLEVLRPAPRQVKVGAVTYTVASVAEWVSDVSGEAASCSLPTGDGNYMRITSTVTSPITGDRMPPVVLSSIVAPQPGEGTLAAKVINADGDPVQELAVQADGPTDRTATTNAAGCAVFGQMEAGSYQVIVDQGGWVDPNGVQRVVRSATVSSGNLTTAEFLYDRESSLDIDFHTVVNGVTQTDERSTGAVLAHTGLQTGLRLFPPTVTSPPPILSAIDADDLFPFPSPYKVFSGRCLGADPSSFVSTYFDTHTDAVVTLTRGVHGGTVDVLEPAVNLLIKRGSSSPGTTWDGSSSESRVYAYPKTAGCTGTGRIDMGRVTTGGKALYPGLPFGTFDICVESTSGTDDKVTLSNVVNTNPAGTAVQNVFIDTDNNNNTCGTSAP
jgi:hypothetical protein